MLKNYVKVALRNLLRHKGYSAINVFGLAIGLACCLIIFQYVAFAYSFDGFHENERDLYRVTSAMARAGEERGAGGHTPLGMAPAFTEAVPEVLRITRLHPDFRGAIVSNPARPQQIFEERRLLYADPAFLEMFTFPLVAGHAALSDPDAALVSETMAQKYFGDANPVGQTLDVTGAVARSYRVGGVFKDVPANSHLQFDLLLPMVGLLSSDGYSSPDASWGWNNFATYVQLRPGADIAAAERKMTEVHDANLPDTFREEGLTAQVGVQPLRDIYLNADISGMEGAVVALGNARTVYFFTIIGLVTLLIALVNYVNLASARALERAQEVGVRKSVGARRGQLVTQFLFESALTNVAAAVLAVMLALLFTPVVNELAGVQLSWALWLNPWFWIAFLAIFAVCTVLAGLYPAFILSSFQPVSALKGRAGSFSPQLWLRRGLVVLQFSASVVLIAGTVVIYNQLNFMRRMDLGLDLEQVLTLNQPRVLPEGVDAQTAMTTFVQEVRRLPAVQQVATSTRVPGQGFNWNGASVRKAEDDPASTITGVATYIDTSFVSLYGLELVAGTDLQAFTPLPDSSDIPLALIPNETAVRSLGYESPAAALGQALNFGGYQARIVGVFKDYNWSSAHQARQNIFLGRTGNGQQVSIRVSTDDLSATLESVEQIYTSLFPGNVFGYAFMDEAFDQQYRTEERFATLFTLFAVLAIFIACLGLFGLAALTTQQRTKEIGVRKVLGASVSSLVALLSQDFAKLVLVAFVVAAPVAYLVMGNWLETFAYRVALGPGLFVLAGVLTLLVALLTVSYQAIRAATANPVHALRSE